MLNVKGIRIVSQGIREIVGRHARPEDKCATKVAERLIIKGAMVEQQEAAQAAARIPPAPIPASTAT